MKNQKTILICLTVILIVLAITYALLDSVTHKHTSQQMTAEDAIPTGMHKMPDGSLMGNASTDSEVMGMDHSLMMVKSEREFLEGMIPHHQEAVDTAKEVIARGGSTPEIKKLAEDIVVAQEKEILLMKDWYKAWHGKDYVATTGAYKPMMRDLSTLKGASLDKVFLEDMVMHHMGAIMMAQSVQPFIEHQEITDLSKAIMETQTKEIELMQSLVSEL